MYIQKKNHGTKFLINKKNKNFIINSFKINLIYLIIDKIIKIKNV